MNSAMTINNGINFNTDLGSQIVGSFVASLFTSRKVLVSVPYKGQGIDEDILSANEQKLDAHIIVSEEKLTAPEGAVVIHPLLLPSTIGQLSTDMNPKKAERLTRAAMLYWNFDQKDQTYKIVPEIIATSGDKYECHVDSYQPGMSHNLADMKERMTELCELYHFRGTDPRLIPELALARAQLSQSSVTTFGNFYARSVNTRHSIFETLRAIHFVGQNAVVYYDDMDCRRWWVKEQLKYKNCIPEAIAKGYRTKVQKRELANGIVELITPIPVSA